MSRGLEFNPWLVDKQRSVVIVNTTRFPILVNIFDDWSSDAQIFRNLIRRNVQKEILTHFFELKFCCQHYKIRKWMMRDEKKMTALFTTNDYRCWKQKRCFMTTLLTNVFSCCLSLVWQNTSDWPANTLDEWYPQRGSLQLVPHA